MAVKKYIFRERYFFIRVKFVLQWRLLKDLVRERFEK
jgi:hypothetical protein